MISQPISSSRSRQYQMDWVGKDWVNFGHQVAQTQWWKNIAPVLIFSPAGVIRLSLKLGPTNSAGTQGP